MDRPTQVEPQCPLIEMSQGVTSEVLKSRELDVPELEEEVLDVIDEDSKSSKQTRELIPGPLIGFAVGIVLP